MLHFCLKCVAFLFPSHEAGDLVELALKALVSGALVDQLLALCLQGPSSCGEIEGLDKVVALTVVDLLKFLPQVAVELVNERKQEEAVELSGDAPSKGFAPLRNNVLYQPPDDKIGSVGVARSGRLFHKLQKIVVVLLGIFVVIHGSKGRR